MSLTRDPLFIQAADVVFAAKECTPSLLQRRLKIGYSRAANLMKQLEEACVIGPFTGAQPRQLLADKALLDQLKIAAHESA